MEKQILEQLINKGLSGRQICNRLNKSQTTIQYWINKYGLKTSHITFSKKEMFGNQAICNKHGLTEYSKKRCKICTIEAVNSVRRKNKQKAIEYKGGCCEKCGYNRCPAALEFHHLDPTKKDPNGLSNRSWLRIKEELDKCILLCSNCHREVHANIHKGV